MARLRPYRVYLALGLFTVGVLLVDARLSSLWLQGVLGLVSFAVLVAVASRHCAQEQAEMWWCVVFSTAVELLATQAWGLYGYRFGNVPFYVPPGHGMIYLVSLQLTRTPVMLERGRQVVWAVFALSTAWALGGLTLLPWLTGRWDVHGALYWPFFAWFLVKSRQGPAYAATFLVTSIIELAGTQFGNWHWAQVMPGLGLPSADPPSVVAGGYCTFALVATWLASVRSGPRPVARPFRFGK